jgi:hypothetical protein
MPDERMAAHYKFEGMWKNVTIVDFKHYRRFGEIEENY